MPSPSSPSLCTRAFQITISVPGDVSVETEDLFLKWIKKNAVMSYVVAELGESDRRHLHALALFKDSRLSKKLHENIWDRFVKPHHPYAIGRRAVLVQVCPGNDWYNTYLKKESGVEVLYNNYDPEAAESYFPTREVQETLMATKKITGVACPWLEHDIETWTGSAFENTPTGALCYLKDRMFVQRNMIPLADKRKLTEKALMYWEYRNGINTPSEREAFLLKQLQDGPAYESCDPMPVTGGASGDSKRMWKDKDFKNPEPPRVFKGVSLPS